MAKSASPSYQRLMQYSQNDSMEATMHQIETLNPREIPVFLSQLSNLKDPENYSRNHNLSLLNALVRIQGRNVVPYIGPIMSTLLQGLEFSNEISTFALHDACSWLVCAFAKYGNDSLVPESERIKILNSLCEPLSDCLMSSQKNVASVCAFCIKALVESNNWKYASSELVNQICSKVVGALEEEVGRTGIGTHLGLAISLVKQNPLVIEPYARSLIKSGLFLLTDGGSQTKVLAVKLIHSIIKCVDPKATSSEIPIVINVLENLAHNSVQHVSDMVFEVLETAKTVKARRSVGLENSLSPIAGLLNPKLSNCNYGSYRESNWETMSAKEEHLFRSSGRRVNGFGYVGSGSREHYPMEKTGASHTKNIIGSGSGDDWRMARCNMHDQCDRCSLEKSSNQLHQRIRRHNSVDNLGTLLSSPKYDYSSSDQKQQNRFSRSPNFLRSQSPLISPESVLHRGRKLLEGTSSESEKRSCGSSGGTHIPSCKACGGWKQQQTKSRGEKRCNFVVLCLVLAVLTVIFAILFRDFCLMDETQGLELVPT